MYPSAGLRATATGQFNNTVTLVRAEGFNVFNHPQFGQPNGAVGNAQVGAITSTVGNPRQLQLGLRFQF